MTLKIAIFINIDMEFGDLEYYFPFCYYRFITMNSTSNQVSLRVSSAILSFFVKKSAPLEGEWSKKQKYKKISNCSVVFKFFTLYTF